MGAGEHFFFGPFHLDAADQALWCGDDSIALAPKELAVLVHLVERRTRLVKKEELLDAIWPDVAVGEGVLKVVIGRLRKALQDDVRAPRFIETAHRRGYRFIGEVTSDPGSASPAAGCAAPLVGREAELYALGDWLARAIAEGRRQTVFITGEPGIGKTRLVQAFIDVAGADARVLVGQGQCLEQYGAGEPYLPVLEALGRLARGASRERLVRLLKQHAPTWLSQMPSLVPTGEREALRIAALAVTRPRMLREMGELVEALSAEAPLLLLLEDLHWSDASTLDLVSSLAQRREPAAFLLVGTYRPTEVLSANHPLNAVKRELKIHRLCDELPLSLLPEAAIRSYLSSRFSPNAFPAALAAAIHRRTEGNALFMVNMVDYLVNRGSLSAREGRWELDGDREALETGIPEDIDQLIERQLDAVSEDERRVLDAASVAGRVFSVAAVAAALDEGALSVEARTEALAQRRAFLERAGTAELPDGAETARYAFIHSLHENALFRRVPATRRALLHNRLGAFCEATLGEAAETAMHFERAQDHRRALPHLQEAAQRASRRHANDEALAYLQRALLRCRRLPVEEQIVWRRAIHEQLGVTRRSMGDMMGAADEFERCASAARETGDLAGEIRSSLLLTGVLFWFDRARCLAVAEEAHALAGRVGGDLEVHARGNAANWRLQLCDYTDRDFEDCQAALDLSRTTGDRARAADYLVYCTIALVIRSDYRAACAAAMEGTAHNRDLGDVYNELSCRFFHAWSLLYLGEWSEMQGAVEDGLAMTERSGHGLANIVFRLARAWLHVEASDFEGAIALCAPLRREVEGTETFPLFLSLVLLGSSYLGLGRIEEAHQCFEALSQRVAREPSPVDWHLRKLVHHGMSRCLLARGDLAEARAEAERALLMAERSGERTYMALGRRTLCEIAMAEGDLGRAAAELARAQRALAGGEAPLAAWRVHATAVSVHERRGERADAARARAQGAAVLRRLADSVGGWSGLAEALLRHPEAASLTSCASERVRSAVT